MNNGISDKLKEAFPNTNNINLDVFNKIIIDIIIEPNCLTDFIDGEGCFLVTPYIRSDFHYFTPIFTIS
jgi:hypothetical protein